MPEQWFLSTPPSRVATSSFLIHTVLSQRFYPRHPRGWRPAESLSGTIPPCFYPRHPRGWRPRAVRVHQRRAKVSIHATLAGGDDTRWFHDYIYHVSIHATLAGGDGFHRFAGKRQRLVSIHATLAGGDICTAPWPWPTSRFYPRHPRGWRRQWPKRLRASYRFYPRHPRGWRLSKDPELSQLSKVSIHATLAGGDCRRSGAAQHQDEFLSTPPSRVATAKVYKNVQCLLRKREKIICKIKNNLKHPPHIPIATSKKCTACPKMSDGIGAKLLEKVCLLPPRTGAATQAAHHPEQIRGGGQGAPRGFCSGCQAGKSAGCRFRGQSARPARL